MRTDRLTLYKRLVLVAIIVLHITFLLVRDSQLRVLEVDPLNAGNPSGAYQANDHQTIVRDFHMHRAYVERIWKRVAERPYTLEGQEKIFRDWAPRLTVGMPHAYSPTAAIIGWPFVFLLPDVRTSFLVYVALNLLGLLLLYQFYLFPRISNYYALAGAALIGISNCIIGTVVVGQTAVLSTCALALTWHLLYEPVRKKLRRRSGLQDVALGLIFYLSTAKPPFAILFGAILLGARAWRPVALGGVLFVLTAIGMASYYGGWPAWIFDYQHFLAHYYKAGMTPFFEGCFIYQIGSNPTDFLALIANVPDAISAAIFQPLCLAVTAVVAAMAVLGRIAPSRAFQLQIANLLLLAPYLRVSEDILIVLLIAEGGVLGTQPRLLEWIKLLLVLCIVNSRECGLEQLLGCNPAYPCKLALTLIILWPYVWRFVAKNAMPSRRPMKTA
jgi:hypothetical protein